MTDFVVRQDEMSKWRLDIEHHEIHAGDHYMVFKTDTSQTTGNTITLDFKTPDTDKYVHMHVHYATKAAGHLEVFEAPTWTRKTQSIINIINNNRNAGNTSGIKENASQTTFNAVSKIHASVVALQSLVNVETIYADYVYSDFITQRRRSEDEIVLEQDTTYVVRLTADAPGNAGYIGLKWYEHKIED